MIQKINFYLLLVAFICTAAFVGCNKEEDTGDGRYNSNYPMQITSVSPAEGAVGTVVLIKGKNFPADSSKINVSINNIPLTVVGVNENGEIMATITQKVGTGPVVVKVGESSTTSFTNFAYKYSYTVGTFVGTGAAGFDNGTGKAASFHFADDASGRGNVRCQLAVDDNGNLFVPDPGNKAIRKVDASGQVSTFYVDPTFNNVCATAVDKDGNVYAAERNGRRITKITPQGVGTTYMSGNGNGTNEITSIAINKTTGAIYWSDFYGDGIYQLRNGSVQKVINHSLPCTITMDAQGNIYSTHFDDQTVIKYTYDVANDKFDNGTVIAGQNRIGGWLDGIGTNAQFHRPWGITIDSKNNLYVAGQGEGDNSNCIRKIDAATKAVTTIAGKSDSRGNVDCIGSTARFNGPSGVAIGKNGVIYVIDRDNNTIRKITEE